MDFNLTDEQRALQEMVRDFADKELKPIAAHLDEHHTFPAEVVAKMGELGLMGVYFDEEYGGSAMDYSSYIIVIEELSRGCAGTGVICSAHTSLGCDPINSYGTEDQKKKFLTPMAQGKVIGCFGLTEPSAGTDAAAQKTTAKRDGDEYVINGSKIFITNGAEAGTAVVFAVTDKEKKHRGISAFIVEKGTPGFSVGKLEDKLGIRASSTAELVFEDCRIPAENLLGQEGQGFKIALSTLDGGRIGIGSQAIGIAQAAFEAARDYAKERQQFGKSISTFQAIQWMLADMATEIEASRLLVRQSAWLKENKMPFSTQSAMAKLFASETAMRVATKAIQIHGGYGYVKEYSVERHFRDAKITEIYEGTSEVQRMVIASNLLRD